MRPFSIQRLHEMFALAPAGTFWRHDVDVSPTAAVSMARFEQERGIRSTFYVMMTSPFYSEREALELAAAVSALGHRVGLHVDLNNPTQVWSRVGEPAVSFHCPDEHVLWKKLDGVRNAYGPLWEGRYFADSRGLFAHGDPEDHFDGPSLQVNLHPEWWWDPHWEDAVDAVVYERFFRIPHPARAAA